MPNATENERAVTAPATVVPDGYDDFQPDNFTVRITRADTWLARAKQFGNAEDPDLTFVLYWTAFNAAYARDPAGGKAEREIKNYFRKLLSRDRGAIHDTIQACFPDPIENILKNRYLFLPFWNFLNGKPKSASWEHCFQEANERALAAMGNEKTCIVLETVFNRLYTLRNQLVHGGARWNSNRNRDSVSDGSRLLESLIPLFIDIMRANQNGIWGRPFYRPGLELPKREG